jgi:hypothetical protein
VVFSGELDKAIAAFYYRKRCRGYGPIRKRCSSHSGAQYTAEKHAVSEKNLDRKDVRIMMPKAAKSSFCHGMKLGGLSEPKMIRGIMKDKKRQSS